MKIVINRSQLRNNPELATFLRNNLRANVGFFQGNYPNFESWLESKVLPGLERGERTAHFEIRDGNVVGLLIVKHTVDEKKLCTLRVDSALRNSGLGVHLFEAAFELLQSTRPLLSISESKLPQFERLFKHFGFSFAGEYPGLYTPQNLEYSFNGLLVPDQPCPTRVKDMAESACSG